MGDLRPDRSDLEAGVRSVIAAVAAVLLGVGVGAESFGLGLIAGAVVLLIGVGYVRLRGWVASAIGAAGFALAAVIGVSWLTYGGAGADDDPQAGAALGLSVMLGFAACALSVALAAYTTTQRPFGSPRR